MEKKIDGHIAGFGELSYWDGYEDWIYLGGAMSVRKESVYRTIPSKEECDRICAELSGEVVLWKEKQYDFEWVISFDENDVDSGGCILQYTSDMGVNQLNVKRSAVE